MPKSLEECRKEFGKVWGLKVAGHEIVFRRPQRVEWRKYKADSVTGVTSKDGSAVVDATEELAERCIVSHVPAELAKIADDAWGDVYDDVVGQITKLQGGAETDRAKKYEPSSAK